MTTGPPVTTQVYGDPAVTARPVTTTGYDTFGDTAETKDPDGNVTTYGYDADGRQVSEDAAAATPRRAAPAGHPGRHHRLRRRRQRHLHHRRAEQHHHLRLRPAGQPGHRDRPGPQRHHHRLRRGRGAVVGHRPHRGGHRLHLRLPGPAGDLDADGAVLRVRDGRLHHQLLLQRRERRRLAVAGDQPGRARTAQYSYDPAGEKTAVTNGAGDTTSYSYNSLGEQTKVTNPDGTATATGYDGAGNVTSTTNLDASGSTLATTSATFDGEGDQLSSTDAAGNSTTFTYDPTGTGHPGSPAGLRHQRRSPPRSGTTRRGTRPCTPTGTAASGGTPTTAGGWRSRGSSRPPPRTPTPANSTFTLAYDADQNPVTETEPGGVTVASTYNNLGELTGQSGTGADAATPTRTFGYDPAGDLTSASTSNTAGSGSNATSECFTYNDRGQVLTASGSAGSTSYAYNGDGLADLGRRRGRDHVLRLRRRRPAVDAGQPGHRDHRDLLLQPRLAGDRDLLRVGQRHASRSATTASTG